MQVVPTQFARENGLTTTWCDIILRDKKGKSSTMLLWCNSSNNGTHFIFGWPPFYTSNGIKDDAIICFELIHNGEMPVMVFHSKLAIPFYHVRTRPDHLEPGPFFELKIAYFVQIFKPWTCLARI